MQCPLVEMFLTARAFVWVLFKKKNLCMFSEKKTDKVFQMLKVVTPLYLSYGSCLSSCLWETYKMISLAAILSVYVGKCVYVYLFNKHFSTAISAFCKQLNEFSYSPFREIVFPTPISLSFSTNMQIQTHRGKELHGSLTATKWLR